MSATKEIFQLVSQDIAINKCLKNNIINGRALAKFLMTKYSLPYTEEAVVSALRRYKPSTEKDKIIQQVLENATIFTKNNEVCVTTNITDQNKLGKILQDEQLNKNIRLSRGKKYTKIIVTGKELESLKSHFLQDQIVNIQKNLSEIRLLLVKDASDTIGLLSKIAAQIALYDVSIQAVIITQPEFLIYVKETDGLKTQEALLKLIERKH